MRHRLARWLRAWWRRNVVDDNPNDPDAALEQLRPTGNVTVLRSRR